LLDIFVKSSNNGGFVIRTEFEYRETLKRVEKTEAAFREEEAKLTSQGLDAEQIKRALAPSRAFYLQIRAEVETYERLRRGEFDDLHNLQGLGHLLIGPSADRGADCERLEPAGIG